MRDIKRLLVWLSLLALTAGVLFLVWSVVYAMVHGRGDQAVSHATTALVVVRVEPSETSLLPYALAGVAAALTAFVFWFGLRRRRHQA